MATRIENGEMVPVFDCQPLSAGEHRILKVILRTDRTRGSEIAGPPVRTRFSALVILAVVMAACSPEREATGSINSCAAELYPLQSEGHGSSVAVCKKCDHGVTNDVMYAEGRTLR
jgi:hypothetical protein